MKSNFKQALLCALLALVLNFFSTSIFSQDENDLKKLFGGVGYFTPGASILTISKLNSELSSKNYPKFNNTFSSVGGGGHAIISNFIIGGEGQGLIGKEQTTDKRTLNIAGGYGVFNLGYILFEKNGLMIYPIVGLGGSGLSISITERMIPKFSEVIDSLKGHIELSTGAFMLNFALGADYLISLDRQENTHSGVLVGIRIGFTFTPVAGDWKMDDVKVSSGPETGLNGVYIKLLIGGGGIGRR